MRRQLFRNPNRLLCDDTLSFSARRVGTALYSRRNRLGQCTMSLAALAVLSGCTIPTVRRAIEALEHAGYVSHCHNYRYHQKLGCVAYARTTYDCLLSVASGYTLIPREIFSWDLTHSAFCVCLCLFHQAGNTGRAFPSIRRVARLLGMGRATVCRALAAVRQLRTVLILQCKKRNCSFSSNSYYMGVTRRPEQKVYTELQSLPRKGILCSFLYRNFISAIRRIQSFFSGWRGLIICKQ